MMYRRAEGSRGVDKEWHLNREEARQTAFSTDEFGDIEIEKFDLDTAGITGVDNHRTYTQDHPINDSIDGPLNNGFDVRELPTR